MNITTICIQRPVATILLSIALCVAGLISYILLPVAPLPQVDFPTISITASLPGASPKTMATSVATPLERSLGTIAGITEMTSVSSLGSTRITVQFDLNRNINGAARDVQAAIDAALTDLPANMPGNPTYRLVNPADSPVILLALTSDTLPASQMYDVASSVLSTKIAQVEGIGEVDVGGSSLPSVRVQINSDSLYSRGLSMKQLIVAIKNFNINTPKGAVESDTQYWQLAVNDQAYTATDYAPMIIAWRGNAPVHLSDIAKVSNSVQDVRNAGLFNGKTAVVMPVYRKPGSNIIKAVDAVKAALPQLQATLPNTMKLEVIFDRTTTIRASLHEVMTTLYLSVSLVIIVVFLFLHSARATSIPAIAIGTSLIGTFAGMYLCGYSLDNLSLMAITVATGFVVDDAIVVLENVSRHKELGKSRLQAAIDGAKEVSFTVCSISISLVAVFIPILLMQGIVGRLFREFAVTLSIAICVSLLLSLTLTPVLCAFFINETSVDEKKSLPSSSSSPIILTAFSSMLKCIQSGYEKSLVLVLQHKRLVLLGWCCTVALNIYLYVSIPKGFFPEQDTGLIRGALLADQSISFQALSKKVKLLMDIALQDPAVDTVGGYTSSNSTSAFISISLKPRKERDASVQEVITRLREKVGREPGAQLFLSAVQDIMVGGRSTRALYQYTLEEENLEELYSWSNKLLYALRKEPLFKDVNSNLQDAGLEVIVNVDRSTASRLGISMQQLDASLNNSFGQTQISTMYRERNQYKVVAVTEDRHWVGPEGLNSVHVPNTSGQLIPLHAFATFVTGTTPVSINHQGQNAAVTISFNLEPGTPLSYAIEKIQAVQKNLNMPPSIRASFQGTAKEFEASLKNQPLLILSALICLYIVLGVLYESYVHPITILSTLPPAGIGALVALRLCGMDFSVISLIGILLLAGIVKKNAIMLVDFAIEVRKRENLDPTASISRACALRFRPIMMTTMAALLGAVPLAIGFGEGAELRRPLGISIIGGLCVSQLLTLYTTPILYLYLDALPDWWKNNVKPILTRTHKPDAPLKGNA